MFIWISSFIPKNISGLTKTVPGGGGNTMIPGPIPGVSDCFLTDQRVFSNASNASSRMRSLVEVNLSDMTLKSYTPHCDNTIEVDCEDGDVECDKAPNTSGLLISDTITTGDTFTFKLEGGANNACFIGSPEINWLIFVKVKQTGSSIKVTLMSNSKVEKFPAFEMYAKLNSSTQKIFTKLPDPGATPADLIGNPQETVFGEVIFT